MFCPKCGALMYPEGKKWICPNCGYEMPREETEDADNEKDSKKIVIKNMGYIGTCKYCGKVFEGGDAESVQHELRDHMLENHMKELLKENKNPRWYAGYLAAYLVKKKKDNDDEGT